MDLCDNCDGVVMRHTILWLKDAGIIECDISKASSQVCGAILTFKGLELLKQMPSSLNGKVTLGENITQAVKDGALEAIQDAAKKALSAGVVFLSNF